MDIHGSGIFLQAPLRSKIIVHKIFMKTRLWQANSSQFVEIMYRTPRDHSLQQSHTQSLTVMPSVATIVQSCVQSTLSLEGPLATANGRPSIFLSVRQAAIYIAPISGIDIYFCVGCTTCFSGLSYHYMQVPLPQNYPQTFYVYGKYGFIHGILFGICQ